MNWINRTSERVPNETQLTSFGFVLKLAAGFACCLSLLMSWCFWSSLGHGQLTIFLLAAAGILFDVTKMLSVPMTLYFWKQDAWWKVLSSLSTFIVLSLVSITAGIVVLEQNLATTRLTQEAELHAIKAKENEVALQQDELNKLMMTHEGYLKFDRVTKGAEVLEKAKLARNVLEKQKQELNVLLEKREFVEQESQAINLNKLIIPLGALLECVSGFLLFMSGMQFKERGVSGLGRHDKKGNMLLSYKRLISANSGTFPKLPIENNELIRHNGFENIDNLVVLDNQKKKLGKARFSDEVIAEKISSGEWPSNIRKIVEQYSIGRSRLSKIFKKLEREGVLFKKGNRYFLVSIEDVCSQ